MHKLVWRLTLACQAIALFAQPSAEKKTEISGSVIDSITGQPIADALVVLDSARRLVPQQADNDSGQTVGLGRRAASSPQPPQRAVTDIGGKFSFHLYPSVGAVLRISHRGYHAENGAEAVIFLNTEEAASKIVKLVPLGAFEGRVVNGDGEPLPGVGVEAIRIQVRDGRRELRLTASKTTDDLGQYRLWYMSPGTYYLKVVGRRGIMNALAAVPQPAFSDEAYGPIYYPNAASQEGAQTFRLAPGETLRANFTVEGRPAFRIRGRLSSPVPNRRILVRMLRGDDPMGNRVSVNLNSGAFEVFDVTPGTYTLQAYTSDAAEALFGETTVSIDKRDVTGINVPLTSGVDVTGTVEGVDGANVALQLVAEHMARANLTASISPTIYAKFDEAGRFTFPQTFPGRYEISSRSFGEAYVASVASGVTDVLASGLTVEYGSPPPLRIQMAQGAGVINGTVAGLEPDATATVVAVRRLGNRLVPTVFHSAREGAFTAPGLTPGEYTLYAYRSSQQVEFRNPAVLAMLPGVTVSVQGKGEQTVTLKLIPKEAY